LVILLISGEEFVDVADLACEVFVQIVFVIRTGDDLFNSLWVITVGVSVASLGLDVRVLRVEVPGGTFEGER
jgi:hypothetical protein